MKRLIHPKKGLPDNSDHARSWTAGPTLLEVDVNVDLITNNLFIIRYRRFEGKEDFYGEISHVKDQVF
jgi:hypothetical protein